MHIWIFNGFKFGARLGSSMCVVVAAAAAVDIEFELLSTYECAHSVPVCM